MANVKKKAFINEDFIGLTLSFFISILLFFGKYRFTHFRGFCVLIIKFE